MSRTLDCFEFCKILSRGGRLPKSVRDELREIYRPSLEELIELTERT